MPITATIQSLVVSLLVIGGLLVTTLPAAAQSQDVVNKTTRVEYGIRKGEGPWEILGQFQQTGPRHWTETNLTDLDVYLYDEMFRDFGSIYLRDSSRDVTVELNLKTRNLDYASPETLGTKRHKIIETEQGVPGPLANVLDLLVKKYAPLIWLAQEERWMPSSIDYFAEHTRLVCNGAQITDKILSLQKDVVLMSLPADENSPAEEREPLKACNFTSVEPMKGPNDRLPFFHGQNPTETDVPIYAVLYGADPRDHRDASENSSTMAAAVSHEPRRTSSFDLGSDFVVQYMTFYPYNLGKNICPTAAPNNKCPKTRVEMDNHVADWELMSIRFSSGKPVKIHVGAHDNNPDRDDAHLEPTGMTFHQDGLELNFTNDSKTIEFFGTHPVVYSALGSHGIWASPGKHTYKSILFSTAPKHGGLEDAIKAASQRVFLIKSGDLFYDETSQGTRWETWNHIVFANHDPKVSVLLKPWPHNFTRPVYRGRWGNPRMGRSGCEISELENLRTVTGEAAQTVHVFGDFLHVITSPFSGDQARATPRGRLCPDSLTSNFELNSGPTLPSLQRDEGFLYPH